MMVYNWSDEIFNDELKSSVRRDVKHLDEQKKIHQYYSNQGEMKLLKV